MVILEKWDKHSENPGLGLDLPLSVALRTESLVGMRMGGCSYQHSALAERGVCGDAPVELYKN